MKEMTLSFRMRGSGAVPPVSSAILVPMMLLPPVHAGAKAVGNRVEEAGGALLKDGVEDNAVGVQHLVQQPVKVVLQHTCRRH